MQKNAFEIPATRSKGGSKTRFSPRMSFPLLRHLPLLLLPTLAFGWGGPEHSQITGEAVRLVPVQWVDAPPAVVTPLILVLADGQRLEIASDFDTATLKRVSAVLQEAA